MPLQDLVDGDPGDPLVFSPARLAGVLRTTKDEIAGPLGLGQDARSRASRVQARKTQTRPREMVEILRRVEACTGSCPLVAHAWLRSEVFRDSPARRPASLYAKARQGRCLPTSTGSWPADTLGTSACPAGEAPNGRWLAKLENARALREQSEAQRPLAAGPAGGAMSAGRRSEARGAAACGKRTARNAFQWRAREAPYGNPCVPPDSRRGQSKMTRDRLRSGKAHGRSGGPGTRFRPQARVGCSPMSCSGVSGT